MSTNNTTQQLTDLMTLQQAYSVDFFVRGYWRVIFENNNICDVPYPYKNGMLAQVCEETSFNLSTGNEKIDLGSYIIKLPGNISETAGLRIAMYDDATGTLERWYRHWHSYIISFNNNIGNNGLKYLDEFLKVAYLEKYNQHHECVSTTQYVLAPNGTINVQNNQQAEIIPINLEFTVYNLAIPEDVYELKNRTNI